VSSPRLVPSGAVSVDRPVAHALTRRGVLIRVVLVLAVSLAALAGSKGAGAEGGSSETRIPVQPQVSGRETPAGEAADDVARGEYDELGLLLMGRHAEMPDIKPPEFFTGPSEPDKPSGPPYKTGPKPDSPVVVPPPALGPGDGTIFGEGDSVLVGQENVLPLTTAGWDLRIDAKVGRTFPQGIASMRANVASVGQVVVIILGHNYGGGGLARGYLDQLLLLSARAQRVVLVTEVEWSAAQPEVNREMYAAAQRDPRVVVAPWAETVKANPDFLADHVHPNASGRVALANLIAVMVGPVPPSDGNPKPPRPIILPIPPTPATTSTTTTRPSTTTIRSVPSTTEPGTSTTTSSLPTSSTTSPSTSSTEPPTSTSIPAQRASPP